MDFLKVKRFGLPTYVWVLALTGGVIAGLYIRSRRAEEEAATAESDLPIDEGGELTDLEGMNYNGLEGLPVGYYDSVTGADYLPDAAGEDSTMPFDLNGFIETVFAEGRGNTVIKNIIPKPKAKASKPKTKGNKPKGGGGPPKRPQPKPKGGSKQATPKKKKAKK